LNPQHYNTSSGWLSGFSKLVVALTFVLIFVGGHTTTAGAGMAFPDWPLSNGSFNPNRWWSDLFQRLEHGHRLIAALVGFSVAVLCAGVWGRVWAVFASVLTGLAFAFTGRLCGFGGAAVLMGLWGTVGSFLLLLFFPSVSASAAVHRPVRVCALLAFLGVCFQAVMGGLRVTIESGGDPGFALIFRVVHGCFAQVELSLLVAVATMLSPVYSELVPNPLLRPVRKWLFLILGALYAQLALGAAMRHRGAGLAIPSFPAANLNGSWIPSVHTLDVDLNYGHTRIGALLVTGFTVWGLYRLMDAAGLQKGMRRAAVGGLFLLLVQVVLGVSVILYSRPMIPTTLHVLNGAALMAVIVLLTVRVSRSCKCAAHSDPTTERSKVDGFPG
jgi:heme a synthase